jgi:hypothetical protein
MSETALKKCDFGRAQNLVTRLERFPLFVSSAALSRAVRNVTDAYFCCASILSSSS